MLEQYQLQYNRTSGLSVTPQWLPMPEGRGELVSTRQAAMAHKRSYIKAWKRLALEHSTIELRIASGRYCIG